VPDDLELSMVSGRYHRQHGRIRALKGAGKFNFQVEWLASVSKSAARSLPLRSIISRSTRTATTTCLSSAARILASVVEKTAPVTVISSHWFCPPLEAAARGNCLLVKLGAGLVRPEPIPCPEMQRNPHGLPYFELVRVRGVRICSIISISCA
jgi:hypothetical protein